MVKVLEKYGRPTLTAFRRLKKNHLQSGKASLDLEFLTLCKFNNVIPNFLHFKSSIKNFHRTNCYRSMLHKLINHEIKQKQIKINKFNTSLENLKSSFKEQVSWLDGHLIFANMCKDNKRSLDSFKAIHRKKLQNLNINAKLNVGDSVITNVSDRSLSDKEKFILSFGLEFRLPIHKLNFISHFLSF